MLGARAAVRQGIMQRFRAAITMISTSAFGSASLASTQARAGRFLASTQAVQTSFIGARLRMSVTQIVRLQHLRLARAALGEQAVDLVQDLLGLALDVLVEVLRDHAGEVDGVAVLHGLGKDAGSARGA